MARQVKPKIQKRFGGLFTAEHPLDRPPQSASLVDNLDVLPGNWLRLMSGRTGRVQATSADGILMLIPTSITQTYGSTKHLVQIDYNSGAQRMIELTIASNGTFTLNEGTPVEALNTAIDSAAIARGVAWAQLPNSIIYNNGYGTRVEVSPPWIRASYPALSQWKPDGTLRFFGLLPIFTETAGLGPPEPAVTFTAGAGHNRVWTSVNIWAGLYNSATEHYSNAIFCGTLGPSGATGTIKVTNLDSVGYAKHGSTEEAELNWVFYASLDGFETAFLIQNVALDGPHTVAVTDASIATGVPLSITAPSAVGDNGWILDATKERPVNNYPPRSFSSICYANGRLYAILSPTKTENNPNWPEYAFTEKELGGVVWSESEGSQNTADFLGDPLQSWPPKNFSPIQAGQYPRVVFPATDSTDVIVLSATHTWLLREVSNKFHRWIGASDEHGINSMTNGANSHKCITRTRHGVVWVTQRNQLAILETGSEKVKILSADYPDAIPPGGGSLSVNCVTYIFDPTNNIDRVDVHFTSTVASAPRNPFVDVLVNRVLRHDFNNGTSTATEDGYTTVAAPMIGGDGLYYHVIGKQLPGVRSGLYTVEGQPDQSFRIPTKMETFLTAVDQSKIAEEQIPGIWASQWLDYGDPSRHSQVHHIDVLGDVELSTQLGVAPLTVRVFNNFGTAVSLSGGTLLAGNKTPQASDDRLFRYEISQRHKRFWKFIFTMESHSEDFGSYFLSPAKEGDQAGDDNFYGSIMIVMPTVSSRENRD